MRIQSIKIAKVFISICILYVLWLAEIQINNMILYGSMLLAIIFTLIDACHQKIPITRVFPSFNRMLVIFGISSFVVGLFVAPDKGHLASTMITYFSFTAIVLMVSYISYRTGSVTWLRQIFAVAALLCAIFATFAGYAYRTESVYVTTLSENNNPNTLGLMMVLGIFAFTVDEKFMKKHLAVNMAIIVWFMFVIVQTGSRKSLLSGALLFVLWYIALLRSEKGKKNYKRFILWLLLVLICIVVGYYVINEFINTSSYHKLMNSLETGQGLSSRANMYEEAFRIWLEHPVFGVGYHQYLVVSGFGKYSHTTYGELLACTGIIGSFIFISNLARGFFRTIHLVTHSDSDKKYGYAMILTMFFIELLLATAMILYYNLAHMLVLTYIFLNIESKRQETI